MVPRSIKKFLVDCWLFSEKEVEKVGLADHYIVWACGVDHIVDRTKTPDAVIIVEDFERYTLNKQDSVKIVINYKDTIDFSYNMLARFIDKYYGKRSFEMRLIRIPEGFYYLEFKLDEKYSLVYQQVWYLTDEEMLEFRDFQTGEYEELRVPFDDVFIKIKISNDMVL